MTIKHTIILIAISAIIYSCASTKIDRVNSNSNGNKQSNSTSRYFDDMPSEPGKCYAKCKLPDGESKWAEVVCPASLNKALYKNISSALCEHGYLEESDRNAEWNEKKKMALVQYQKDNNLPFGSLNVDTLKLLEVQF